MIIPLFQSHSPNLKPVASQSTSAKLFSVSSSLPTCYRLKLITITSLKLSFFHFVSHDLFGYNDNRRWYFQCFSPPAKILNRWQASQSTMSNFFQACLPKFDLFLRSIPLFKPRVQITLVDWPNWTSRNWVDQNVTKNVHLLTTTMPTHSAIQ